MPKNELTNMHAGASKEIFRYAEMLRNNMTSQEKKLWAYLRTGPLGFKFRRQHPLGKFVLDFYCHKKKLSIEIDGNSHLRKGQILLDQERTLFLFQSGIKELRYSNEIVTNDFETVINEINEYLK
jgi:very-short-patch-repair endonuclease